MQTRGPSDQKEAWKDQLPVKHSQFSLSSCEWNICNLKCVEPAAPTEHSFSKGCQGGVALWVWTLGDFKICVPMGRLDPADSTKETYTVVWWEGGHSNNLWMRKKKKKKDFLVVHCIQSNSRHLDPVLTLMVLDERVKLMVVQVKGHPLLEWSSGGVCQAAEQPVFGSRCSPSIWKELEKMP